jgi:hypothetical protein
VHWAFIPMQVYPAEKRHKENDKRIDNIFYSPNIKARLFLEIMGDLGIAFRSDQILSSRNLKVAYFLPCDCLGF